MNHLDGSQELQINPRELLDLYLKKEYNQLSEKFISVLSHFENTTYLKRTNNLQHFINIFVKTFLYLFTQPDYLLPDRYVVRFIQLNPTISNLVAISSHKTTDAYLEILKNQTHNFAKLLVLYSSRNTFQINYQLFFDAHPQFACLWYSYFFETYYSALINKEAYRKLKDHLKFDDVRLKDFYDITEVYLGASYIDNSVNQKIKSKLNQAIKRSPFCQIANIKNKPNTKKIAIVTSWGLSHKSVEYNLSEIVKSLNKDYDLTLINLGKNKQEIDPSLFNNIEYVNFQEGSLNLKSIQENNFAIAYYPNLGISPEGIILSNIRLAPIQICGLGHPVSTFGSEIDYFFSGADVEAIEGAEERYSERLVLLPGNGFIYQTPNYKIKNIPQQSSDLIINCPCLSQQLNYPLLCIFLKILKESKKKIRFRFFVSRLDSLGKKNAFIPLSKDLNSILGKNNFELITSQTYEDYMILMEEGDICLDTYHFGNSYTIAENLYLRKPVITLLGNKWYNRISSQMLRQVGLSKLVTTSPQQYIDLALKLIHDNQYRTTIEHRLKQVDLNQTIFNSNSKKYFKKAIDFLIHNHKQIKTKKSRKPIRIKP